VGVKKLVLLVTGVCAATSIAIIGAAEAYAGPPDVRGQPYALAQAILRSQGYSSIFGGSIGNELPQYKCIVIAQTSLRSGKQRLRLDCNVEREYGDSDDEETSGPSSPAQLPVPGETAPGGDTGTGDVGTGDLGTGDVGAGGRPTPGAPGVVTVIPKQVG